MKFARFVQITQYVVACIVFSTGFWYALGIGPACIAFGAVLLFDLYYDSFIPTKG